MTQQYGYPKKQGLYDPAFEKDACGVGFVAHIKGERSHQIILDANEIMMAMEHRGACGCEANTGDGAGMLTGFPHEFLCQMIKEEQGIELPAEGKYGAGLVFLPTNEDQRNKCKAAVENIIAEHGQRFITWRPVPTNPTGAGVGPTALSAMPHFEQLVVAAADDLSGDDFERQLYIIRKRASHQLRMSQSLSQAKLFYICSLSWKVMIYKGMLTTYQVVPFFPDLSNPAYITHLAMVHSRFSTNTFPSWDRAQPNRFMAHNGEINTLRGNMNSMSAREGVMTSTKFGDNLKHLFPISEPDCSDSGTFDNVLEFLYMTGRTLQESVMMMVPEAWQKHDTMPENKRAFYEYHSALMEPWDGPASIVYTDGKYIGAVLDRNGLRPSRYYLTHDDKVVMASEVGVLQVAPANVKYKGRLQPGRMFLVDFQQGRLIPDDELKNEFADRNPYAQWLIDNRIELAELPTTSTAPSFESAELLQQLKAFGYTSETLQFMLLPLLQQQRDPVGSMGNDAALACLSDKPRMIYDYFKQLFAQVTNPAIDSIREGVIMSLECYIGPEGNLLDTTPAQAQRLLIPHPILSNGELAAIKEMDQNGWKTKTVDITYSVSEGTDGLSTALSRICDETLQAIDDGYSLVVLSDRATSAERVPISSLLATGAVHHHLIKQAKRTQIGLVLESGEAREVHHHCLLAGFGIDAINPYLAFESLWQARLDGLCPDDITDNDKIVKVYKKAVAKGMLKVMGKMGISTLQSYKGAQIFEAIGLQDVVIDRCFVGTASRVQGVDFDILATESLRRHTLGFPPQQDVDALALPNPGQYHWRSAGERHGWDPTAISDIQHAARNNDATTYQRFAEHINHDERVRCSLRGLLSFKSGSNDGPIDINEVEPAADIVKRFVTGAMSFGSISAESHETLAIAMNRLGGKSNTGEGGEDPERFLPLENGDSKRSAIKQVASGRFGVTIWYLANADEIQIKISQGAKPGEGGELPGRKVNDTIARIRYSTPGVGLISPPPHHDIYSIEDLSQLIHDLKNANPSARISVKLVSEVGVGTVAAGVSKAHADHILISGHNGGTGASPLTSIKHAGLPWELGIAETHQTLVMNDLRSRTVLQTDGGLKTGRDVAIAALLGAEEFGFSTAPLITLGCIMMRKCHLNTCPVGIATQDAELRARFAGKPEHVVNYLFMVAEECRQYMAEMGFKSILEMVGRVDCLETQTAIDHWKADGLDLTAILTPANKPSPDTEVTCTIKQDHGLEHALDNQLLELAKPAIQNGERVEFELPIVNTNRTVGTILSHHVVKSIGGNHLPEDTIQIHFTGSAGQSFGAFLAQGISMDIEGDANDYVGKGLSGGRISVYPPRESSFTAEDNFIAGNVCLYGATGGEAFFRGQVAERFCVRNSGANAVVEGVGDHCCEYMTGGRTVILGPTGRNFAAGMSGGVAYVWDQAGDFNLRCNLELVELEQVVNGEDIEELKELIARHYKFTESAVAEQILEEWDQVLSQFIKVMPTDYKRVLEEQKAQATAKASSSTN